MDAIWWIVLSVFSASVSGGLVYFVMSSSTAVKLARQREKLAAANAALGAQKEAIADSMKYAKESARREALDDFLSDIRIEERHYVREHKALFITRKSVVRQERIFFRNLPLSNWIEQEMPYEEGADIDALARTMAVFAPEALLEPDAVPPRRLLR
ncbi:MAG TPA: hypothetical protein VHC90_01085 [Bryobacteraceae bacterium]|nr:hypothetical protein [Bryobacteraceae bacterium]